MRVCVRFDGFDGVSGLGSKKRNKNRPYPPQAICKKGLTGVSRRRNVLPKRYILQDSRPVKAFGGQRLVPGAPM